MFEKDLNFGTTRVEGPEDTALNSAISENIKCTSANQKWFLVNKGCSARLKMSWTIDANCFKVAGKKWWSPERYNALEYSKCRKTLSCWNFIKYSNWCKSFTTRWSHVTRKTEKQPKYSVLAKKFVVKNRNVV